MKDANLTIGEAIIRNSIGMVRCPDGSWMGTARQWREAENLSNQADEIVENQIDDLIINNQKTNE